MKKITLLYSFFVLSITTTFAQSAFDLVYDIFEAKCNTCHSNASQLGNLDLEGAGTTPLAKKGNVLNNLINVTPANSAAADAGLSLVEPGRSDLSFLFHKVNNGFDSWIEPMAGAGGKMPVDQELTDTEKELIRQWILFGADKLGKKFDEKLIEKFYTEGGNKSYPNGPPPAPAAGEGFQIKIGPFYLNERGNTGDELEFFTKYALDLPENVEVNRIDLNMSTYSHHLILYNFGNSNGSNLPNGLRLNANHSDVSLVAAVQEPTDLMLPKGTAFRWKKDIVLDLNGHYINYSPQGIYQAEAYVNVYTQPTGTAKQEMFTDLLANVNIWIPNNGEVITEQEIINPNGVGEVFLWAMAGHTHKYGTDYKVYKRENFSQSDLIYDAACPRGIPDCSSPFFDYRHIPTLYFDDLEPLTINFANGLVHQAQWINNGTRAVRFGPTSDDEMMVLVLMFVRDTAGLNTSGIFDLPEELPAVSVYPNPATDKLSLEFPKTDDYKIALFEPSGKLIFEQQIVNSISGKISTDNLPNGFYLLKIEDSAGRRAVEKVFIQKE